jgi:hypothetical protein
MKSQSTLSSLAIFCFLLGFEAKATNFANLDFERAVVSGSTDPWKRERTADLLPGWELTFASGPVVTMLVGSPPPGVPYALLADRRTFPPGVFAGRFSLYMAPGFTDPFNPEILGDYSLSQTGEIPLDAKSLRFQGDFGIVEVRIDGAPLALFDESPDDSWFSANLHDFAGKSVLLEFRTQSSVSGPGQYVIDSIEFSSRPIVPEISVTTLALVGFGILGLADKYSK